MISEKPSVLIVDDDKAICDLLHDQLTEQGYLCTTASDGDIAVSILAKAHFHVVLLDIKLPSKSGLEVLREVHSSHYGTIFIVITCVCAVDIAVKAMKMGASDYIVKPFDLDKLTCRIRAALDTGERLSDKKDYEPAACVLGQEDKAVVEECFKEINAIARGVEARHDLLLGHSKIVTEETIEIARGLGIPEATIQSWATKRSERDSERMAVIESLLDKLKQSFLAQKILGVMEPHWYMPRPKGHEN